ncbi:MAG: MBL fold metallo-hydrolase, partial [Marinobacter sp.]
GNRMLTGKLVQLFADVIQRRRMGPRHRGLNITLNDGRLLKSDDYTHLPRTARKLIVGGDNDTPELLQDACPGTHVLIHEATYTQDVADRVGPWPQHSSAQQVARFAQRMKLPNLVLTHFSSRYQSFPGGTPNINQLAAEALQHYQGHLFLAQDFGTYQLATDLQLHRLSDH